MHVAVLTPAQLGISPGQRFRIEQWMPYLEEQGFTFEVLPFETAKTRSLLYQHGKTLKKAVAISEAFVARLEHVARARAADVVFLYREASLIGPAVIERLIARGGTPIVYDFDDPIWLSYKSPTSGWFSILKSAKKTQSICRLATSVTVGNRLLANYAVRHSSDVHILPSTIDLTHYPPKPASTAARVPVLGWTGSHSTIPFLELLVAPLSELTTRCEYQLTVISHTDRYMLPGVGVRTVARKWNAATEATDLHALDIGLAPFPNTGWTPWRCHGKVLQYMAVGIPVVASPVGIVPDYVQDGVTGFLAQSPAEWVDRLQLLISDAPLRAEMGAAARRRVAEQFEARAWAKELGIILRSAAARSAHRLTRATL